MKKVLFFNCMCLMLVASPSYADDEIGEAITLQVSYNHDWILGHGAPKGPIQPPYVTLDDHTLYIWSQHNGYTLTLLDDNDTVVYQSYVAAGVQYAVLPMTLSGSYTLILSDDTYLFTGMIDLE